MTFLLLDRLNHSVIHLVALQGMEMEIGQACAKLSCKWNYLTSDLLN